MMSIFIDCNYCNANEVYVLYDDGEYPIVKCKRCGLVYISPRPTGQETQKIYYEKYYSGWLSEEQRRKRMWEARLRDVESFKRAGRLLDVGCGLGTFLGLARSSGWQVWGTEVSDYAVGWIDKRLKIEVFKGNLEDAGFEPNFFDVITMWHVLEHLPDPFRTLRTAWQLLKEDGIIVIEVPNVNYPRVFKMF